MIFPMIEEFLLLYWNENCDLSYGSLENAVRHYSSVAKPGDKRKMLDELNLMEEENLIWSENEYMGHNYKY